MSSATNSGPYLASYVKATIDLSIGQTDVDVAIPDPGQDAFSVPFFTIHTRVLHHGPNEVTRYRTLFYPATRYNSNENSEDGMDEDAPTSGAPSGHASYGAFNGQTSNQTINGDEYDSDYASDEDGNENNLNGNEHGTQNEHDQDEDSDDSEYHETIIGREGDSIGSIDWSPEGGPEPIIRIPAVSRYDRQLDDFMPVLLRDRSIEVRQLEVEDRGYLVTVRNQDPEVGLEEALGMLLEQRFCTVTVPSLDSLVLATIFKGTGMNDHKVIVVFPQDIPQPFRAEDIFCDNDAKFAMAAIALAFPGTMNQ